MLICSYINFTELASVQMETEETLGDSSHAIVMPKEGVTTPSTNVAQTSAEWIVPDTGNFTKILILFWPFPHL